MNDAVELNETETAKRGSKEIAPNQENVDYDTAIESTGCGKFNLYLLVMAFPAVCAHIFDTGSLPLVMPTASCDLNLTSHDRGLLDGAVYAGMLTTSFAWGLLADTLGRQKLLALGYLLDVCFSVASSQARDKYAMFACKYLSGCVIAGPYSMVMSYISEMFIRKYKDSVVLCTGVYMSLGGVIQPIIALVVVPRSIHWELFNGLITLNSWRLFLVLSASPALTAGILALFCPESPKFLLSRGRKSEAIEVFRYMYSKNTGLPVDSYPVKSLKDMHVLEDCRSSGGYAWLRQMSSAFRPPHLKNTITVCLLQFLSLCSLNSIRLWLPQFFYYIETVGGDDVSTCSVLASRFDNQTVDCAQLDVNVSVYLNIVYTNLSTAAFMALSSYLVKKIGKKTLLVSSYAVSAMLVLVLPWVRATHAVWVASVYSGVINIPCIGIVGLVVELFPTYIRTLAVSLTMTSGRVGVVMGSAALPTLLCLRCWAPFATLGVFCTFCAAIVVVLVSRKRRDSGHSIT